MDDPKSVLAIRRAYDIFHIFHVHVPSINRGLSRIIKTPSICLVVVQRVLDRSCWAFRHQFVVHRNKLGSDHNIHLEVAFDCNCILVAAEAVDCSWDCKLELVLLH